jgi:hypothetical protein
MKAKEFIPASKPRNFVAKNQKTAGAGAHKDKKKAEKQGDTKHKAKAIPMDESELDEKSVSQAQARTMAAAAHNPEFAKKVKNPLQKEVTIYTLLEHFTDRIHPDKDIFTIDIYEAKMFFDLIDGDTWTKTNYKQIFVIVIMMAALSLCLFLYLKFNI